jgi:diguanylate cyclase (GGDEF)-like protein
MTGPRHGHRRPSPGATIVFVTVDLALLTQRLPRVTAAGTTMATAVEHVARPVDVVDATLPLAGLERAFRSPDLSCVAVRGLGDGEIGLVTRRRFLDCLSGRLGFGRALLARGLTADITDWSPLIVDPDAGVLEVALAAMERPEDRRYDAVLVRSPAWQAASASDLVVSLSTLLAVRTLHDPLTTLANRPFLLHQLRDRCARMKGTPHRVAVIQVDVIGFSGLNATLGHFAGDAVLTTLAAHVRRNVPPGWDVGRTGADEVTAVGTVLGPVPDDDAAFAVGVTRTALATALPHVALAGHSPVQLRAGAVFSTPGGGKPDRLFHAVQEQVRRLRRMPRP